MYTQARPMVAADPLRSASYLLTLAQAATRRGDHHEGAQLAESALDATPQDAVPERALALRLLALNLWRVGEAEPAARVASDALLLYEGLPDQAGVVETLNLLCMVYNQLGLNREALDFAIRALKLSREIGDKRLECWSLNRVGIGYEALSDAVLSLTYMQESLALAQALPQADEEVFAALNNLASSEVVVAAHHRATGDTGAADAMRTSARGHARKALELARRSGNSHRETIALGNLADAMNDGDGRGETQTLLEQFQTMARRHGYRSLELQADFSLARLLCQSGRHALAVLRLEQLLAVAREADEPDLGIEVEHALYEAYKILGRFEPALAHLEAYSRLEQRRLKQQAQAQARVLLARMEVDQAHADAERARLDAELQRLRAQQLEDEHRTLRAEAEALGRAAREDALTGLSNRRMIDEMLPRLLDRARAQRTPFALAMLDLDHFKQINDRFGHGLGDQVLSALAQLLRANTRGADLLARVGGEEFIVVLDGAPIELAHEICERLRGAIAGHTWRELAAGVKVTVSIGLVAGTPDEPRERLIERADAALYEAKRRGRNRVHRG
jgi:diguanylate cyclase (GGDEF)-like protein